MNTEEFADCLDRWGSDLEVWPRSHQPAGKTLLADSHYARQLLVEAERLDQWLAMGLTMAGDHRAPPGLARRIVEQIPEQDFWQHTVDWFSAALWRPAVAATCMLLLGFGIGLALPEIDDDVMLDDVSMLVFSPNYEELEDVQQ